MEIKENTAYRGKNPRMVETIHGQVKDDRFVTWVNESIIRFRVGDGVKDRLTTPEEFQGWVSHRLDDDEKVAESKRCKASGQEIPDGFSVHESQGDRVTYCPTCGALDAPVHKKDPRYEAHNMCE